MALRDELQKLEIRVAVLEKELERLYRLCNEAVVRAEVAEKILSRMYAPQQQMIDDFIPFQNGDQQEELRKFDAEQEEAGKQQEALRKISPFSLGFGPELHPDATSSKVEQPIEAEEDSRALGDDLI